MSKTLALCADDFGLAPGISSGIAALAHARRLTAVSCIANSPHWGTDAALLRRLPDSVDVGLHLNFTEGRPLSPRLARRWPRLPGLARLIVQAHLGLLPLSEMRNEAHAQLAEFMNAHGSAPRFVDGHQHVHHLPGLRDVILDMVDHVQPLPAIRSTAQVLGPGFRVKRWLIEHSGGRGLGRALAGRVLAHNATLLGAYDFAAPDYGAWMRRWLAVLPDEGALLFCHPGAATEADSSDAIAAARRRELSYLQSDAFAADLAAADVVLGKVWQARPAAALTAVQRSRVG
jgi:hypothetical protein